MLKNQTINLRVVEKVANSLEELNNDVIYVGGAVVSLYVTDEGAEQPRPIREINATSANTDVFVIHSTVDI